MSKFNPNAAAFVPRFTAKPVVVAQPAPIVAQPAPVVAQPAPVVHTPPAQQPVQTPPPEQPDILDDDRDEPEEQTPLPPPKPATPEPDGPFIVKSKNYKEEVISLGDDDLDDMEDELDEELAKELESLEVVEDKREHLNVIFIGHVDAGKSTIAGNTLLLTGQVDERTIQKYEKEAKEKNRGTWFLAYIMDTNEEERAKGKTVEVGRAHFETEKKRYTILDAPGHKNYVPNMIGGASQADVAILVISAKGGEFESGFEKAGQTREHAILAKTVGLSQIIVLVNKMDEPTVGWSQDRYNEIVSKLTPFLKKELRFPEVHFLPLSGYSGANLKVRVDKSVCPWFDGKSLLELLDDLQPPSRNPDLPLRLPVVDRFKDMGTLQIIGKVEAGTITKGSTVLLLPNKTPIKVVAIFIDEKPVNSAGPGEYICAAVSGAEENEVSTGHLLSSAKEPCKVVDEFIAQISILDTANLITAGYTAVIHIHTCIKECTITDLIVEYDRKTNKPGKKPRFVKAGSVVEAKIQVQHPIPVELFEDFQQLGRFTLRDKGKTIAIGKIIKLTAK
eukprot:TRINITY_DN547_c0_g2_i1.p1 TRINITY_DN547_c0_g2~~TRINITY_DN547_c0_g2_i1.p1  ORF type:complete len:560 (-),score=179.21 TRINITY_DN547_c0_g2_i1:120-1799(-)